MKKISNDLNIETERTKTVIAADHGTHRVFHPSVIKVAFTFGQRLYEFPHGGPCRRAHPVGTFAIDGNPLLARLYIAGMLNGILVPGHQVRVNRLPYCRNPYLIHTNKNSFHRILFHGNLSGARALVHDVLYKIRIAGHGFRSLNGAPLWAGRHPDTAYHRLRFLQWGRNRIFPLLARLPGYRYSGRILGI